MKVVLDGNALVAGCVAGIAILTAFGIATIDKDVPVAMQLAVAIISVLVIPVFLSSRFELKGKG